MVVTANNPGLRSLRMQPFDLLRELERRSIMAAAGIQSVDGAAGQWVGVGFRIDGDRFVISRDELREVLMVPPAVTRVPGARSWVRGLANVRGHLLPLMDMREFLGGGSGGSERSTRVLVLASNEYPVGLLVDEVFGFRRFVEREHGARLPQLRLRCERYLLGCFQRNDEIWPVFSARQLLAAREFQRAAAD